LEGRALSRPATTKRGPPEAGVQAFRHPQNANPQNPVNPVKKLEVTCKRPETALILGLTLSH
jgi:hypothetical protein